ncbi:hypothetical protein [Polyangium mundeleinium]|uniref:Uncharacterized protein n=1 Tax=Polyangium mundeleinium TaxID=2995306 RepID=A0ABT5EP58_9BACT|nr:hypothetical protein [Polyangium mundeleinium]MDC0743596.1 hypothetical protein [Polyangium mundeleinium]
MRERLHDQSPVLGVLAVEEVKTHHDAHRPYDVLGQTDGGPRRPGLDLLADGRRGVKLGREREELAAAEHWGDRLLGYRQGVARPTQALVDACFEPLEVDHVRPRHDDHVACCLRDVFEDAPGDAVLGEDDETHAPAAARIEDGLDSPKRERRVRGPDAETKIVERLDERRGDDGRQKRLDATRILER